MKKYIGLLTPFLLILKDKNGNLDVLWLETEEELLNEGMDAISRGYKIDTAMEIAGCRPLEEQLND